MVPYLVVLLLIARPLNFQALDISQCIAPLGIESGLIPDRDISASSSYNDGNVGSQNGRLNQEIKGGAWCPKTQVTTEGHEWLEINLHSVHIITATASQGRFGNGDGVEYTEEYILEYWRPKLGKWVRYRGNDGKPLPGNTNTYLVKKNHLEPVVWASKIRFVPYSIHRRTICMRVEVYGCNWSVGVVAYAMPKGDKRSNDLELNDNIYDGQWGEEMRYGLGQLVDGQFGGDDIREASKTSAWVGWKNESRPDPPVLTFEFDKVREFSAVHIFCNNRFMRDVQVFSEAIVTFSIGGRHYQDDPIHYSPVQDKVFESSRNVTIKLHHRIGRWVRIELFFAARWILISEVVFDSDIAQGNHTPESNKPSNTKTKLRIQTTKEMPMSNAHTQDPLYMTIIVGVLTALVILLAVAVSVIIHRHRHRKYLTSPVTVTTVAQRPMAETPPAAATRPLPPINKAVVESNVDLRSDDYQEPYQVVRCAPYVSYNSVLLEMRDFARDNAAMSDSSNYDYAVPELCSAPLLTKRVLNDNMSDRATELIYECKNSIVELDARRSAAGSMYSRQSTTSFSHQDMLMEMKRRLDSMDVVEFPRHRLRMISKLAEGIFGSVYVAEAECVPVFGGNITPEKRLLAVKFLCSEASLKERDEFEKDIRVLSVLSSPYLARVVGACRTPPLAVVLEYLELGDLHTYLRSAPSPNMASLLHICTQIAAGMQYLESLNFVHRDLAARNCLVGNGYQIKISDFGTDNEVYACDYYKVDGRVPLPLRWAAWESVMKCKYTTKSDVWAFAVTLFEIFSLCRRRPYEHLSDCEVVENLAHLQADDGLFEYMDRCVGCPPDVYDMMCRCWRRDERNRPTFGELHLMLQRKAALAS